MLVTAVMHVTAGIVYSHTACVELDAVNAHSYSACFTLCNYTLCQHHCRSSPIQGISRLDTTTGAESVWMAKSTEFMGAIAHIPYSSSSSSTSSSDTSDAAAVNGVNGSSSSSSDESSGYVVGILTDGAALTSELLIFKASDIAAGPICR
jgi:Retinal pigment epithelial membrane protein